MTAEHALQRQVQQALAVLHIPCFRLNSGAIAATYRGRTRFVRFGFPGCPDLFALLADGRTLWIEVKGPAGRLTPEQLRFGQLCAERGIPWVCARSLDDLTPWVPQVAAPRRLRLTAGARRQIDPSLSLPQRQRAPLGQT